MRHGKGRVLMLTEGKAVEEETRWEVKWGNTNGGKEPKVSWYRVKFLFRC